MSILCVLGGIAVGCLGTTLILNKEYCKCKAILEDTKDKLESYKHSNKELLGMVSHLQEVIKHEQS